MIVGLGIDVVGIARIAGVHARHGERFLTRVYTEDERRYCLAASAPAERLAARWAAKEACMKALGTGWAHGVRFTDIAVIASGGPPELRLVGEAAARARALGVAHTFCSLTHADGIAAAVVVLEAAPRPTQVPPPLL